MCKKYTFLLSSTKFVKKKHKILQIWLKMQYHSLPELYIFKNCVNIAL